MKSKFPYTLVNNNERHYQAVLYTNSKAAMDLIDATRYAASFADDKRKVYLVGINFSKDCRTIDDWSLKEE